MAAALPSREVRRLVADLPDQGLFVGYGGGQEGGALAADIAVARPAARVLLVAGNAAEAAAAQGRLAGLPNTEVVTADSLDVLAGRTPAAVIIKPTGFEGMDTIRAKLAEALETLEPEGRCYLMVHRRRGGARLAELLHAIFGNHDVLKGGGLRVLAATKHGENLAPATVAPAKLTFRDGGRLYTFQTGPGLFSRDRIDLGAQLLLDAIDPTPGGTLLDLGCGYGVLGVVAAGRDPAATVVMVDADARAVRATRHNVVRNDVRAEVVLADGLAGLDVRADDIVTNFPLHIPRDVQRRLLAECRDTLAPTGRLWLCALAQYDLRDLVREAFGNVEVIAETVEPSVPGERYRILCARRPE